MDATHYLREYIDSLAGCKIRLKKEEEIRLAKLAEVGDRAARDRLIESQLPYVINIAHKFSKRTMIPIEDLVQYGNLGLMHAVEKFDWRKGFRLSTYCTWWIRQCMFNQTAVEGLIHLPRSSMSGPLLKERKKCQKILSMSLPYGLSNSSWADVVPDKQGVDMGDSIDRDEYLARVRRAVDRLPDRLRDIMVLRCWDGYTLEEVGAMHGVTRERIRQLEVKAKRMFKDYYTRDQLRRARNLKAAG